MKTVILGDSPPAISSLIAQRKQLGQDTHDELWQGDYHMAPAARYEHGAAEAALIGLFRGPARLRHLKIGTAFNLGDLDDFRVPDLGVHRGSPGGVWLPTAAIVVEVRSPDDESYEKFEFYFDRGVEEILIADLTTYEVQWWVRGASAFERSEGSDVLGVSGTEVRLELGW